MSKTSRLYVVTTEKFGDVSFVADSLADARTDARHRFGVRNPKLVRLAPRTSTPCAACDSRPCVCP